MSHDMEFPGLMVCAQNGYKTGALADMGFPEDTLRTRSRPTEDNFDFDPENVWEEGTYSMDELAIGWLVLQGKGTSVLFHLFKFHTYIDVQGSTNRRGPGFMNFVLALAYHFCLNMHAAFTQPGARLLVEPCTRL